MRTTLSTLLIIVLSVITACGNRPENEAFKKALERNGKGSVEESRSGRQETPVKWVSVADMAENGFRIDMPEGWTNAALIHRAQGSPRSLVTAVAPDKNTVIYFGDPRLPLYSVPNPELENSYRQLGMKVPYRTRQYVTAEKYFSEYLQERFGKLEGFRIIEKFDNLPLLKIQEREKKKLNINAQVTNASYRFEYRSKGRTIHGELSGTTIGMGTIWLPEVSGFCTTGDPVKIADMMKKMMESRMDNPQWQEEQNAKHRQTMAMIEQNTQRMTQQHQQNMANIQRSSAAHQQRMADLQQSYDASNDQWSRNQASIDKQHEKFLNVIKGEHTVMDKEGNTYQVDNSKEKYFVDKHNNIYIGADGTTTLDDLRKIKSINIDNFENVQIIR